MIRRAILAVLSACFITLPAVGHAQIASVYHDKYHGRKTASGVRFNTHDATMAAHRTLPFGARVRVTNQRNGRSLVVVIRDRGPFIRGRVIDLSRAGARALGFSGLTRVSMAMVR